MICILFKFSKFAVFVFSALLILLKNNVNAIDQLDLILCGRKGNQYYVTSTPFITQGAYLYADLLIKAIEAPWPVKKNGAPYTHEEFKLEIVRKVILTSPSRLRCEISKVIPPKDSVWIDIMGKMNKYPRPLRIINDVRFSVFLCGPDMLDSPILIKFIEKVNRKYGYNFNPFSDKVINAALKMHGVPDSTVKRKIALSEKKNSPTVAQEKEKTPTQKIVYGMPPIKSSLEHSRLDEKSLSIENKLAKNQKPSLILSESEFDDIKDEKSFESDYSKTPPFPEEEQKQSSLQQPIFVPEVSNELPETLLVAAGANAYPQLSLKMPNISDIRVSQINKSKKYALNLNYEPSASTEDYEALKNETFSNLENNHKLHEDIGDIDISKKLDQDEEINIGNFTEPQTEVQYQVSSPTFGPNSIEEPELQIENKQLPKSDSEDQKPEYSSKGTIGPPPDHKPLEILVPFHEYSEGNTELEEDARNYKEQEEIANKIEANFENEDSEEDEDFEEEYDEEYEFASEDEYNQYLDYRNQNLNNNKVDSRNSNQSKETKILNAKYPLGKKGKSQKALLQDVSSVFTDLLNAVKSNKISEKNVAFGIPAINLKLNTRSKAIVFGDRVIKKWKAENIDGVLKSIPIFHQGSFDELPYNTKDSILTSNSTKESTYIEVDFNSAIRSHDENEGGYIWIQRNLIATRTTSGFQDVLIKAALKGLETLTSVQCSSILSMPISSTEVEECISAYFGSIYFGQNKVYGAMTENDEEKSISGFEISKAFITPQQVTFKEEKSPTPKELDEADLLIRSHLKLSAGNRKEKRDDEEETSDFDMADKLIRKNLGMMPSSARPNILVNKTTSYDLGFAKDRKSQFSENSQEFSDELSEEASTTPPVIANATNTKHIPIKFSDLDLNKNQKPATQKLFDWSSLKNLTKNGIEDDFSEADISQLALKENDANGIEKADNQDRRIPDEYIDPEFIEKALEKLAINATETYKRISSEFKMPTSDLETTMNSYYEFLNTVELWTAIAGEALIFTGGKMKAFYVSKSKKLSYFYSREEFYVYQAILNYSSSLIASMNSFGNLRKNLEEIKELLRKSFTTTLSYKHIKDLSDQFYFNLEQFNYSFGHHIQLFCGGLPVNECLGTMRNDFYRRNEKFSNFIARNGSLKRAVHQILEMFGIKVSTKDYLSIHGGTRDDVNRYLAIKGYISNQVPIFTEKFSRKLLKEQLSIDRKHATHAIKVLLDKHGLISKTSSCGDVKWESKDKNSAPLVEKI
ncbi:uncharacterized protein cubi_00374 [Cryptosporidium ubiquitum]|uniref:Uncharacterized protein n=1 Tax=Cryptosporidium ubiquitum TaxID=857276 RepID=A0A1J4MPM2_9CRYT|nr:uncharacterized protein cubi_00374 [Cryptosporidium ubiquitum]OII74821.1 hypothetical protein cubi_00374 [Cryptosporidium ubiquitum]